MYQSNEARLYTSILDLDTKTLAEECFFLQNFIVEQCEGIEDDYGDPDSPRTTQLYKHYNIFTTTSDCIHRLYREVSNNFRRIQPDGAYGITGWLNVYTEASPMLNEHKHFKPEYEAYHGYYVVTTPENKPTRYIFDDGHVEVVESHNNLLVIGESGKDSHVTTPVVGEELRISIAFDICPVHTLISRGPRVGILNRWVPV